MKLCMYMLTCGNGEITEALDIHERTCLFTVMEQ